MSTFKLCRVLFCCALLPLIAAASVAADEPSGVVRTFAVLSLPESTPNFYSEDSKAVLVSGKESLGTIWFAPSGLDPLFQEETEWDIRDAKHILRGHGADEILGFVAWLSEHGKEPPPIGSVTFTGDGSPFIVDVKYFWFESGDRPNEFRVIDQPGGSGSMLVVTAVFTQ